MKIKALTTGTDILINARMSKRWVATPNLALTWRNGYVEIADSAGFLVAVFPANISHMDLIPEEVVNTELEYIANKQRK